MAKNVLLVISFLWLSSCLKLYACDACGCAAGGYFGVLPQLGKNFLGIRWIHDGFNSKHPLGFGEENQFVESEERFNNIDFLARVYPLRRIQLHLFVPYRHVVRSIENVKNKYAGVGDLSVICNYEIVKSADTLLSTTKHNVYVGGGAKFPTGRHIPVKGDFINLPSLQPGTGSFDFLLNMVYTLRRNSIGINSNINYKINTSNKFNYQFGSRLNCTVKGYLWKEVKALTLLPQLGLELDWAEKDAVNYTYQANTGGYVIDATADFDMYFGKFAWSNGVQLPLNQKLSSRLTKKNVRFKSTLLFLL